MMVSIWQNCLGSFGMKQLRKAIIQRVGDWVYIKKIEDEKKAIIHRIFHEEALSQDKRSNKNRRTDYSSKCRLFILVNALNHDFNVRRMERYLLLAYESGAMPVIVLTKSSICNDVEQKL